MPAPFDMRRHRRQGRDDTIDDTLMKELEVSLDDPRASKPATKAPSSLDDEMTRLLGELSSQKR